MSELTEILSNPADYVKFMPIFKALLIMACGTLLARILHRRIPVRLLNPQNQLVVRRTVKYIIIGVSSVWALREVGVNMGILLGTAGILTVAIGFAAQTSASNLISGAFLMAEQPFVIGDIIEVEGTKGKVISIDLLSVRLCTFDNLMVRIPNAKMLESNVTNFTHFPIRRYDMKIAVAYKENLEDIISVLKEAAERSTICLEEPEPMVLILGYGESSINLQFSVWSTCENFLQMRNIIHIEVKRSFDEKGIEIPFPHRTLTPSSASKSFSVKMEKADEEEQDIADI